MFDEAMAYPTPTPMKPKAAKILRKIGAWTDGGGNPNQDIPFQFCFGDWSCCLAGGVRCLGMRYCSYESIKTDAIRYLGIPASIGQTLFTSSEVALLCDNRRITPLLEKLIADVNYDIGNDLKTVNVVTCQCYEMHAAADLSSAAPSL